jgi:hypothetical protein
MFFALVAVYAGPTSPGTAYEFSHHSWGEYEGQFGRFAFARGGMGAITKALASVAQRYGAEIHTCVTVDRIVVRRGVVAGVRLEDGKLLECKIVLSNADPCHTYLQLLDPNDMPSTFLGKVRQSTLATMDGCANFGAGLANPGADGSRAFSREEVITTDRKGKESRWQSARIACENTVDFAIIFLGRYCPEQLSVRVTRDSCQGA